MNDSDNLEQENNEQNAPETETPCEDFLSMAHGSAQTPTSCATCGNHECSHRQVSEESALAAELLGAPSMVVWSFIIFIVPLLAGIAGSYSLNRFYPPAAEWKALVGFIAGLILGVFVAWLIRIAFMKDKSESSDQP
ncbi:MAG: hypothetical protein IKX40_10325 [Thermoguttaceae bacterium]|nr:hypothetical protein [Thermoguttaceae bacterium]